MHDGPGFSTPLAAQTADITERQARYWAETHLVVPTIRETHGRGIHRIYNLRDIMALRTVGGLRKNSVSCQGCRKIQALLRAAGDSFASRRLVVLGGKRPDVLLVEDDRAFVSLLARPGQSVMIEAVLPLAEIERETKRELALAIRKAKKNARASKRRAA